MIGIVLGWLVGWWLLWRVPALRDVREGRPAAGRGWIGLTPRGAYETRDVTQSALLPPWVYLLLASGFLLGGWLREGRR